MAAASEIHVYHCICAQLAIATRHPIETRATRQVDRATIFGKNEDILEQRLDMNDRPTILRLEDGFEKRYALDCCRCNLMVGYHLDKTHFDSSVPAGPQTDVLYILPGALQTTDDMAAIKVTP